MPRLAICSRDLHWHWISWTLLCDKMEVSMLRLAWLTTARHVFQPALTGRLELVSRKFVSRRPRTKAIAVSKFREKLSPANWVQGVTAISRKISCYWAPKMGLIDWYFISKKCTYIYINSTYKQIKSSMCIQRYMYHLVAAREIKASLSKLTAFRLSSTWLGHELIIKQSAKINNSNSNKEQLFDYAKYYHRCWKLIT